MTLNIPMPTQTIGGGTWLAKPMNRLRYYTIMVNRPRSK